MNSSTSFLRIILTLISVLLCTTYGWVFFSTFSLSSILLIGLGSGLVITTICFLLERLCKGHHLNKLLIVLLGITLGTLIASSVMSLVAFVFEPLPKETYALIKGAVALFSIVLSLLFLQRSAEELAISIPFIRFKPLEEKSKDIIIDLSILQDSRLIDLSNSGILDRRLILPCFIQKELQLQIDSPDETTRYKAKKCLETIKRLESNADLQLNVVDADFPETHDIQTKLVRLAKHLGANILTADINRIQQSLFEGVRIINIHSLSNALKPLTQNGELISIKIQRYGKEPLQGVGYLDDGTMVVVNGASKDLDKTIRAQVLSVKHTSSGRMIFCNTVEDAYSNQILEPVAN